MNVSLRKAATAGLIATFATSISLFVGATPAAAVGGDCTSAFDEKPVIGMNHYRAGVMCYSLQSDSRARAKLVRNGGPDYNSSWSRSLNVYTWTDFYTCYAGCHDAYEIAHI